MGTTYIKNATKKSVIAELIAGEISSTCIKSTTVGSHLWMARRCNETGSVTIVLALLSKDGNFGYGYKLIDETEGPAYYDCPQSILDLSTETRGYSAGWKESVEKFQMLQNLPEGSTIVTENSIQFGRGAYSKFTVSGMYNRSRVYTTEDGNTVRCSIDNFIWAGFSLPTTL